MLFAVSVQFDLLFSGSFKDWLH